MCTNKTIKELLPAYREQVLAGEDLRRVEDHLARCEDCRGELALLAMMAEEPVPDPGEAFWASLLRRVEREVRDRREKKALSLPFLRDALAKPRWAWAAASAAVIVAAAWLMLRPDAVDVARIPAPEQEASFEDVLAGDPVTVDELSSRELDAVSRWARNESRTIGDAMNEESMDSRERDISEDLNDLSTRELDRVYEMLKKKEQELRNKGKKPTDQKGLG